MKYLKFYFVILNTIVFFENTLWSSADINKKEASTLITKKNLKRQRKEIENIVSPAETYRWSGRLSIRNAHIKSANLIGNIKLDKIEAESLIISGSVPHATTLNLNTLQLNGNGKFSDLKVDNLKATGVVYLLDSTVSLTEIKGQLHATNVRFSNLIIYGAQIYLENITAENIFVINNSSTPTRIFCTGKDLQVKNIFFLTANSLPQIKRFITKELTEEAFFHSGILLATGQVIKESGTVEIIHSKSSPKYFGLSNGISIQVTPTDSDKFLEFEVQLIRPNGEVVKLPQ